MDKYSYTKYQNRLSKGICKAKTMADLMKLQGRKNIPSWASEIKVNLSNVSVVHGMLDYDFELDFPNPLIEDLYYKFENEHRFC